MARKKRKVDTYSTQAMRGHTVTATRPEFLTGLVRLPTKTLETNLQLVEDRRKLPHDIQPHRFVDISGNEARVQRRPEQSRSRPMSKMLPPLYHKFERPERVPVCIRRQARRRVLFALRRTGRRARRSARWTAKSFIRCK